MNRYLLVLFLVMTFGLTACDRGASEPTTEHAAAPATEPEAEASGPLARTILVTGSTGTQGGAVARELLDRGYNVRGLTRDADSENAKALAALGAIMVEGDYDDTASIAAAMDGVDGVFAVTLFWHGGYDAEVEQGKMLVDEARKADVGHFVLTSVAGADSSSGIPHFESKWEVEQYLHESDLNWTIIRPVEFMDNWGWSLEEFSAGQLLDPRRPETSHQWIAASDIGFFAAEAFDNPDQWIGVTQEIAGDQLTIAELRATLSRVFGSDFEHVQMGWDAFEDETGEEITHMFRWFENDGYSVDIEALRVRYPDLKTAEQFLSELAASTGD